MKAIVIALVGASIATALCAAPAKPSIEELKEQYERRLLSEVSLDGRSSYQEIQKVSTRIAKEVYSEYPDVLKSKAEELLRCLPVLHPDSLASHVTKENRAGFDAFLAVVINEDMLFVSGWEPRRVALSCKNLVLAKNLSTEQFARRQLLTHFVPDRVYLLAARKKTTLAVKCLKDFVLIEVRLGKSGLLIPEKVTWMVAKGP